MISDEIELVSFENIKLFSKKVTHKISKQNLKQFIKTTIQLENINFDIKDKVLVSYIDEVQTYEIYILNSSFKYPIIISQIFEQYDIQSKQINLYITNKFFTVYKNSKLYFSKINDNYTNDDIVNYIQFNYKLKIDNIYNIDETKLDILKDKYIAKIKKKNIPLYISLDDSRGYIYFIVYIGIIFFALPYGYYIYLNNSKNIEPLYYIEQLKELKMQYKNLQDKKRYKNNLTQELIELFNHLKIYKISIVKFKYKKMIYLTLISKKKKNIYDFISVYDKDVKIKNIAYEEKIKNFIMDIEIEL